MWQSWSIYQSVQGCCIWTAMQLAGGRRMQTTNVSRVWWLLHWKMDKGEAAWTILGAHCICWCFWVEECNMLEKMASYIVNSKWYEDRKIDIQEDSERIVVTAANLLKASIREASYSKDTCILVVLSFRTHSMLETGSQNCRTLSLITLFVQMLRQRHYRPLHCSSSPP